MNLRYKMLFDNVKFHTVCPGKMAFIPGGRFYALQKTQDINS